MAIVLKRRARKPLAQGPVVGVGRYPNGVGGIEGHAPCISFSIGDISVIFTDAELREALNSAEFDPPDGKPGSSIRPWYAAPVERLPAGWTSR
jgi:hypothetical protein